MSKYNDSEMFEVAVQIESYLNKHPNAADTIEGIAKWWLTGQVSEVSSPIIQRALNYLVSKLVVKCNASLSGNIVYSSNKTKAE